MKKNESGYASSSGYLSPRISPRDLYLPQHKTFDIQKSMTRPTSPMISNDFTCDAKPQIQLDKSVMDPEFRRHLYHSRQNTPKYLTNSTNDFKNLRFLISPQSLRQRLKLSDSKRKNPYIPLYLQNKRPSKNMIPKVTKLNTPVARSRIKDIHSYLDEIDTSMRVSSTKSSKNQYIQKRRSNLNL